MTEPTSHIAAFPIYCHDCKAGKPTIRTGSRYWSHPADSGGAWTVCGPCHQKRTEGLW